MKSSSKALLRVALLLGLIAIGVAFLHAPAVPDQVQIANQLEAARAAGEAHNIGGMMSIVSDKYHDSNVPSPVQLRLLLNHFQGNSAVRVTQTVPVVAVQGDTATSTSHLRIVTTAENRLVFDRNVTIQWAREDGTRLGVIPTKVWRVVSADYGTFGLE